jgi:cob(I)alamin adenosyltransferase
VCDLQLAEVQSRLLDVGSAVATPMDTTKSAFKLNRTRFSGDHVGKLEVKPRERTRACSSSWPSAAVGDATGKLRRCTGEKRAGSVLTGAVQGWIDAMDEELPQLTMFILPSGGKAASFLQMARSVRTPKAPCVPRPRAPILPSAR